MAELQADDIVELLSLRDGCLIVTRPLGHGHLRSLLSADIHYIDHSSTTCFDLNGERQEVKKQQDLCTKRQS